jgi:phage shock protein C
MNEKQRNDVVLIIGVLILVAGLSSLASNLGVVPPVLVDAWARLRALTGPLSLVLVGVLVVLFATRGVSMPSLPPRGTKLYRSASDRWLSGVCGGIAAYLRVDPLVVRAVFVLLTLLTGLWSGIVTYLVLALVVIPAEPGVAHA